MDKRRLGKTEMEVSVVSFGSCAIMRASEKEADETIEKVLAEGMNHFDVAPIYGLAEKHIGSWIKRNGKTFSLSCKTTERKKEKVWESIKRSLDTLNIDQFDIYQFHGVDDIETLDILTSSSGGLEAVLEARDQKLLKFIGITGHVPPTHYEALSRFDFDTVMFPLNRIHAANPRDWNNYHPLLEQTRQKDVGVFIIKSIAKGAWTEPKPPHKYNTWYEPFDQKTEIEKSIWFALNQDVSSVVNSGDMTLIPDIIEAAKSFKGLSEQQEKDIIYESSRFEPLKGPNLSKLPPMEH